MACVGNSDWDDDGWEYFMAEHWLAPAVGLLWLRGLNAEGNDANKILMSWGVRVSHHIKQLIQFVRMKGGTWKVEGFAFTTLPPRSVEFSQLLYMAVESSWQDL